jgi:hypothetical protein
VLRILLFDILCNCDLSLSLDSIFRVSLNPIEFLGRRILVPDNSLNLVGHRTADADHNKSALVNIRLAPGRHIVIRLRCQHLADLVGCIIILLQLFNLI